VDMPPWVVEATASIAGREPESGGRIIAAEPLAGRGLGGIGNLFRGLPGLILQDSFGGFEPARLSLRGSGLQSAPSSRGVVFELDGLPLGLSDGSFNSAYLDPALTKGLQVRRGPGAWREAGGSMGGGLNFLSDFSEGTTLSGQLGSFEAASLLVAGGWVQDSRSVSAAFSRRSMQGEREHSRQERNVASLGLKHGTATLSLYAVDFDYEVPGPLTLQAAFLDPESVSAAVLKDNPRREGRALRLAAQVETNRADFHLKGALSWLHSNDSFRQLAANGQSENEGNDLALRAGLNLQRTLFGKLHHVQARVAASQGWRQWRRFLNESGKPGALFADHDLEAGSARVLIEDGISLGRHFGLSAGVALQWARREASGRETLTNPAETLNWSDTLGLPQAMLVWRPSARWGIYASVTESGEAPTFDDLLPVVGTAPRLGVKARALEMQRSATLELGTRGTLGRLSWDMALYQACWKGEILRLADANGLSRGAVNADQTLHEGFELSLRHTLWEGTQRLTLAVHNTLTRARFRKDPLWGDRRLAGLPPCQGAVELQYEHEKGYFAVAGADWTAGRTQVDHAGRLSYGGTVLGRLRMGLRRENGLSFFVELRNLTNRRWIASTAGVLDVARNPNATSLFLPGLSRSFQLGVEWRR